MATVDSVQEQFNKLIISQIKSKVLNPDAAYLAFIAIASAIDALAYYYGGQTGFRNNEIMACSPFSDPDVMRVPCPLVGVEEALDDEATEAAYAGADCTEVA